MTLLYKRQPPESSKPSGPVRTVASASSAADLPAGGPDELGIEQIVRQRLVTVEFQPIVRLDGGETIAYEAFARGPASSAYATPAVMFQAAAKVGLGPELDNVAHAAAFTVALAMRLDPAIPIFLNADPKGLLAPVPEDLVEITEQARSGLQVFMEISEQTLAADPHTTLAAIAKARELGWGIVLDDIGMAPDGLVLLPLVRPDVIKLGMTLVRNRTHPVAGRVVSAVSPYAADTGIAVMAEGIETEAHLDAAVAMGAAYGQGYFFRRPLSVPLDVNVSATPAEFRSEAAEPASTGTPYEVATAQREAIPADLQMVKSLSRHFEQLVWHCSEPLVVLSTVPGSTCVSGAPLTHLVEGRPAVGLTAVFTHGGSSRSDASGLRMVSVGKDDPLQGELNTIVIGPHVAVMVTARPDPGHGKEAYRYLLSEDRTTVLAAVQGLMRRLLAAGPGR